MAIQPTYPNARANLASLLNSVSEDHEIVVINRRGANDVALIAADELSSLMETAHLLRSPKNVERLLSALKRARRKTLKPKTVETLRRELRLGKEE